MTSLTDRLVEACATARLIEPRAQTIVCFARTVSKTPDTDAVKPEE